jgi:hypothetical protein
MKSITVLLFSLLLISAGFAAKSKIYLHPNEGELLCFEHTNIDHGMQFNHTKSKVYFKYKNCSGHDLVIKSITCNNGYTKRAYSCLEKIGEGLLVKNGAIDSIGFERVYLHYGGFGLYDNSWTISFQDRTEKQHLNIFCELIHSQGSLSIDEVTVPTVNRGDTAYFSAIIKNLGNTEVLISVPKSSYYLLNYDHILSLNRFPITVKPNSKATIRLAIATDKFLVDYEGSINFNSDDINSKYGSFVVPFKGHLISENHPSIKFDSLVLSNYINKGEACNFDFWFENNGDLPLIFSSVKTSCGCLVATWPREPIQPGERNVIKVKYDSNRIGPINKSVTIICNASELPIILRVKGEVRQIEIDN